MSRAVFFTYQIIFLTWARTRKISLNFEEPLNYLLYKVVNVLNYHLSQNIFNFYKIYLKNYIILIINKYLSNEQTENLTQNRKLHQAIVTVLFRKKSTLTVCFHSTIRKKVKISDVISAFENSHGLILRHKWCHNLNHWVRHRALIGHPMSVLIFMSQPIF